MNSSRPFSFILPFRIVSGPDQDGGRCAVVKARVMRHGGDVNDGAKHDDLGGETSKDGGARGPGSGKKTTAKGGGVRPAVAAQASAL